MADNLIILEQAELASMSSPEDFCERIRAWVVDFGGELPDQGRFPGLLQARQIEGRHHLMVIDQDENYGQLLQKEGALSANLRNLPRPAPGWSTRETRRPRIKPLHPQQHGVCGNLPKPLLHKQRVSPYASL